MRRGRVISLLVAVGVVMSCIFDTPYEGACSDLNITLEFPASMATKSDVGQVPASDAENAVYDLTLWVFRSNDHEFVCSLRLPEEDSEAGFPQSGTVRRYTLPVPSSFALERPKIDVYVLVNAASVGKKDLRNSEDWDEVSTAFFGEDFFGPQQQCTSVPTSGLPMSGVRTNLSIQGKEPSLSVGTIPITRAVSKLRYVFSQLYTEAEDDELEKVYIDRIVLDGDQIPVGEKVFSESGAAIVSEAGYVSGTMVTSGPEDAINTSVSPERYTYAGQNGPTYERLIQDGISGGMLTQVGAGAIYLRESDKALKGTVYYRVQKGSEEPVEKPLSFSMNAPGDFSRNHTWTLYGYYVSGRTMELAVTALPWDWNRFTIDFSVSSLMVTDKLKVDGSTVNGVVSTGVKDHYYVYLKPHQAARAYLYVATPMGGQLQVIPVEATPGAANAFKVTMGESGSQETNINPDKDKGRIDIYVDRNDDYVGETSGKMITLSFKAFINEREIPGASETIDQIYYFVLP